MVLKRVPERVETVERHVEEIFRNDVACTVAEVSRVGDFLGEDVELLQSKRSEKGRVNH